MLRFHRPYIWFFIYIFSLLIVQLQIDNAGGTGRNLPQTAIAWGLMTLFSLSILWKTRRDDFVITPVSIGMFSSTILLWIPLLFTDTNWQHEALWPLLGLFAGIMFYICVLQINWSPLRIDYALLWVVLAALLQTIIVLIQQVWPDALSEMLSYPKDKMRRSGGVFQQVNLLASFISTGLVAATLLHLKAGPRTSLGCINHVYRYGLMASLVLFPVMLVIQQSRIGWIGGGTVILLLVIGIRQSFRQTMIAVALLVSGIILGALYLHHNYPTLVTHDGSNHARIIMLRETMNMIISRPWFGWGYGGFEYNFQHYRLAHEGSTLGLGVVTHPHNEYLYRWAEGGLTSLAGMLLFTFCGLWLLVKACKQDLRSADAEHSFCLAHGLCLLPFFMHTQTEYPFYLSALHWGIFIFLLATWDKQLNKKEKLISLSLFKSHVVRGGVTIVMCTALIFTATGGYSGWLLWQFENKKFEGEMPDWNINPWLLSERAMFDAQVVSLLTFNYDRNLFRLDDYSVWAQNYLAVHVDREVYARLVQILRAKADPMAKLWETEAYGLFPDDSRFQPQTYSDSKVQ